MLAYLPSPPANGISLGPLRFHAYGLIIALGAAAAVWLAQKRWRALGGSEGAIAAVAVWALPGGLIGARLYSDLTSWQVNTGGDWVRALEIWRGGLGIWGGVLGGVATGALGARRMGLPVKPLLDTVAPALPLAQAVGRWGNYFNQELYGWRSGLPWAVKIDHPVGYPPGSTFQPTFLYECAWDLVVVGLVLWAERRLRLRRGYLFAVYCATYVFGRFFTEYMRIDPAHRYLGLRLNDWTSVAVFVVATGLLTRARARPGDDVVGARIDERASLPDGGSQGLGAAAAG